jgi:transcriptional regulator with XRE-family HTH domain
MAHSAINPPDPSAGPLARKIYTLIAATWPEPRTRPGVARIAAEIGAATGGSISATYLNELLRGKKSNPGKDQIEVLARFFGVAPQYFFDDDYARRVDAQLGVALALRDTGVSTLVRRAQGLSPDGLAAVLAAIQHIRAVEKLPDVDGEADPLHEDPHDE